MSTLQCPPANSTVCTMVCSNNDVLGIGVRIYIIITAFRSQQLKCHLSSPDTYQFLLYDIISRGYTLHPNHHRAVEHLIRHRGSVRPWPPFDCHHSDISEAAVPLPCPLCHSHPFLPRDRGFADGYAFSILMSSSYRAHPPVGNYQWTTGRFFIVNLLQFLSAMGSTAWGLYVWANVADYGSQPACNDQIKYIFIFKFERATESRVQKLWIVIIALNAAVFMYVHARTAYLLSVGKLVMKEQADEPDYEFQLPDFYLSLVRLPCVAPPLSLVDYSRTAAQCCYLCHGHSGAYGEYPALSYQVTLH